MTTYLAALGSSPIRRLNNSQLSHPIRRQPSPQKGYTIEQALTDIQVPSRKKQAFIFINRYFSPEALAKRGEFPSKDLFVKVVRLII
jgi:hypothetical protein